MSSSDETYSSCIHFGVRNFEVRTKFYRMVPNSVLLLVLATGCIGAASGSLGSNDYGITSCGCGGPFAKGEKRWEWVGVNVKFPCAATKKIYESTGRYSSKNMIATRFQSLTYKDDMVVALPRYKDGGALTLAKLVFKKGHSCTPVFQPYPCWSMQEEGNCEAIQSAVDIFLDNSNRLWVLDSGVTNTLNQPIRRCPPKVFVICTKTHKVIRVIDLSRLVCPSSRLQYLVVDQSVYGHTYLYISDAATRSIIVWDVSACRGWRVVLPKAVLAGCSRRDVLYLALVKKSCGSTVLYFTYLSSTRIFSIRTEFLRRGSSRGRVVDLGRKPAKMIILGVDGGTKIFFRYQGEGNIYQWDTLTCFNKQNFVLVHKGGSCRLTTHVAPGGTNNIMYGLESNFQDYIQGKTGAVGVSLAIFPLVKPCKVHQAVGCKTCV